jgi:hypothetical protein
MGDDCTALESPVSLPPSHCKSTRQPWGIHSVLRPIVRTLVIVLAAAIVSAATAVQTARTAVAAGTYGVYGYDISWPQCGGSYPTPGFDVAIVGVTGGHGFSGNPCLASEFSWSQQATLPQGLYVNIDLPGTAPAQGATGPAGKCAAANVSCFAYNYGFNNSQYAVNYASARGVDARVWWLDVETNNNWQTRSLVASTYRTVAPATPQTPAAYAYRTAANAEAIAGAIAGLTASSKVVGAYSTDYQWNLIAGSYAPQVPVWYATADNVSRAPLYCTQSHSFTGGPVWLVQYTIAPSAQGHGFDGNYACTTEIGWESIAGIHLATLGTTAQGDSAVAINDNRIYVRPNSGHSFGNLVAMSTAPFYGSRKTVFAPLDGAANPESAVAINDKSIWVMRNTGGTFGTPVSWSNVPFYGSRDTLLADIDGSGFPSAVAINDNSIWVMRMNSTKTGFTPPQPWSSSRFFGSRGTFIADLDGRGMASAVAVNDSSIWVMRSSGSGFAPPRLLSSATFYGSRGVFMADLDGHGVASAVAINDSSIWVERNNGSGGLAAPSSVSNQPFFGTWQYMADVDGSGRQSAVAVSANGIWVKQNQNGRLGPSTQWFSGPLYGTH